MALLSLTLVIDYLLFGEDRQEEVLIVDTKTAAGTRVGGTATSYTLSTSSSSSFYVDELRDNVQNFAPPTGRDTPQANAG